MKTITDSLTLPRLPGGIIAPYLKERSVAVFDIETMGLYARQDEIILTGVLVPDEDFVDNNTSSGMVGAVRGRVIQFFSDMPGDEPEILRRTIEVLQQADIIVTYNGQSFDIPFLKQRAAKYGIPCELPGFHLDLFTFARVYTDLKQVIGSLSQKNVERYMGLASSRDDQIDGGESVRLFNRYRILASADSPEAAALEQKILLHNHDDVVQLYRILPLLLRTDLHRAMYHQGFPAGRFVVKEIKTDRHGLTVTATPLPGCQIADYMHFPTESEPYNVMLSSASETAEFTFPAEAAAPGVVVLDLIRLIGRESASEMVRYPAVESGYLILRNGTEPNYMEINAFIRCFLSQFDNA